MNKRNSSIWNKMVVGSLGLLAGLGVANTSLAATSIAQAFETCREHAEVAYGSADQLAEIRLDGVRKSGRQLRLKVFTPAGDQILALCNVNRRTGLLVSIDPPGNLAQVEKLTARN
ncbi:MAG: hypothetical protein SH820_16680 [Xanthomonadales bacterium]|nr:hypothetical protein [Xanthomonadales bacterium]